MPELPEVETIKSYLHKKIIGKTIRKILVLQPKQFYGKQNDLEQTKINAVFRQGKIINIATDNNRYINIHLKMTGQIIYENTPIHASKSTRVIFYFSDNSLMIFNDQRKFGWIKITGTPLKPKGIDILSAEFTFGYLFEAVHKTNKPIKTLLMDQNVLAGMGNIYSNDALWLAKINPLKKSASLSSNEISKLFKSIKAIITEGIEFKGSSAKDRTYVRPDGKKGSYQFHFKVYEREGQPCLRCLTKIIRVKQTGRSSFYCPKCQKIR